MKKLFDLKIAGEESSGPLGGTAPYEVILHEKCTVREFVQYVLDTNNDWINRKHYQVDEDGYDTMTCNKCGKEIDLPSMEDYYFCPICGAKMKGGDLNEMSV